MWRIKKLALNAMARIMLPVLLFNDSTDAELDLLFWALTNAELTNVKQGKHDVCFDAMGLVFKDVWTSNRWYAWLTHGRVYKNGNLVFRWDNARPSAFVMWSFRRRHGRFDPASKKQKNHKIVNLLYEAATENDE